MKKICCLIALSLLVPVLVGCSGGSPEISNDRAEKARERVRNAERQGFPGR